MDLTVLPHEIENIVIYYLHQICWPNNVINHRKRFIKSLNIIKKILPLRINKCIISEEPFARVVEIKWHYWDDKAIFVINGFPNNTSYYNSKNGDFYKHTDYADPYNRLFVL